MTEALSFILIFSIILVWTICYYYTIWKLFQKAGQPGWAAIIPIYNIVVMGKIAKQPFLTLIVILSSLFIGFVPEDSVEQGIIGIVTLISTVALYIFLAKRYDRGLGFWLSAILFPFISAFTVRHANYKPTA